MYIFLFILEKNPQRTPKKKIPRPPKNIIFLARKPCIFLMQIL